MLTSILPRQLVSILCWCSLVAAEYQDWLDYPLVTPPAPIRIMKPAGKEVRLQCWKDSQQGTSQEDCCKFHEVVWQYKKCGTEQSMTSCQSLSNDKWVTICGNGSDPCQGTLVLNTSTEGNSGMYRCSVSHRNKTSRNFKVTQTYELEIVDLKRAPPEFLFGQPSNITVFEGEPAVFQCRVHSKGPTNFFWFLQQNHSTTSNTSNIKYLNDTYKRMNSSGERYLSNDIHLSKLILPQTSQYDSGYYQCVAINDGGFQHRGAHLTVLSNSQSKQNISDHTHSSLLPLLFLIPAALALVPLVVLACCLWRRRCRRKPLATRYPGINMESAHYNNNPAPKQQQSKENHIKYTPVKTTIVCATNECRRDCGNDKNYI